MDEIILSDKQLIKILKYVFTEGSEWGTMENADFNTTGVDYECRDYTDALYQTIKEAMQRVKEYQ